MRQSNEYLFKVAVVGTLDSGKSQLISSYVRDLEGTGVYKKTIGVDFRIKAVPVSEDVVKLQIWDIAGQERFNAMRAAYYRDAKGVVLTYSAKDRASFEALRGFYKEVHQKIPEAKIIVVGTHADAVDERQVRTEEAAAFAEKIGAEHFEVSLETQQNVSEAFDHLAKSMHAAETKAEDFVEKENVAQNVTSTSTSHTKVKVGLRTMHSREQHQVGFFQSAVNRITGNKSSDAEDKQGLGDGNDEVFSSINNDML